MLIYDGWRKVPVPISDRDVAIELEKRKTAQPKPSKRQKVGRSSKAHGELKGKGKARAKDDDDAMDDDKEPEEPASEDESEEEILDWCAYVNKFDVCITTYTVLQQDLGVARAPPVRPRRAFVQYSTVNRSRSPLVMCEWYRVIMDEVQMAGGGKTECVDAGSLDVFGRADADGVLCREMVSLIPRLSSFAVSGTPARSQVADLIHILKCATAFLPLPD